jgi:hypothetical protein
MDNNSGGSTPQILGMESEIIEKEGLKKGTFFKFCCSLIKAGLYSLIMWVKRKNPTNNFTSNYLKAIKRELVLPVDVANLFLRDEKKGGGFYLKCQYGV